MSSEVETSLNISALTGLTTTEIVRFLRFGRNDKAKKLGGPRPPLQKITSFQSAGTGAPVYQVDVSPEGHPSSRSQTCIRRPSLTDREFLGRRLEPLAKSKLRLCVMLPPTRTAHDRVLQRVEDLSPISTALSFRCRRYRS